MSDWFTTFIFQIKFDSKSILKKEIPSELIPSSLLEPGFSHVQDLKDDQDLHYEIRRIQMSLTVEIVDDDQEATATC